MSEPADPRRDELTRNLGAVRERIRAACARAGRSSESVTLTVVTKFFPASDVRLLADLGVRHVGENRHQEAVPKAAECADLDLSWHFIGGLQSNKAAAVAGYADVVESVDRPKVLRGLSSGAREHDRFLDVLVQVDLDQASPDGVRGSGRAGARPESVREVAQAVLETDRLRLRGVMAVAPLGVDPRPAFARLAEVAEQVRVLEPSATWVSAGMSNDLEAAVEAGATHVRIGSAVLGARPSGR
ncbi:MAG TPA: YggS family pyridoxal phosphate-dependent enzyme [Nocardioidaceae bacterium]|nr:YggS family pyridoxal phosphate-dependent enzyme [Nocardioidaceae bacterium]